MRVMYVQYAGDFAEAYDRLYTNNGEENYYGQCYSVKTVVDQARKGLEVSVLTTLVDNDYERVLERNLTASGIDKATSQRHKQTFQKIEEFNPDRVVLRMPDWRILKFLRKKKISVFPVFADSFDEKVGVRSWIKQKILTRELCAAHIKWVANHQINASKSLLNLGLQPGCVLPYDWEHDDNPDNWTPHVNPNLTTSTIQLFFAGNLTEKKGVFDIVKAVSHITNKGRSVDLRIAGTGDEKKIVSIAQSLDIEENIKLLGNITHKQVLAEMNIADVVIVPSHHSYPEGLPMTIMESMLVQTPLVVSDHPMFVGRLPASGAVEFFEEKRSDQLAEKVLMICHDLELYRARSEDAKECWGQLTLKLKWADMINNWLSNNNSILNTHSLSSILNLKSF
ncbi:MAG: glycosyltransferase involved in cell wall biosynthesis [Desulforhopalus sp.]|jgi:glycosyltransferase involved in cell wall biosynthesis